MIKTILSFLVLLVSLSAHPQVYTLKVHSFLPPTSTSQSHIIEPWCKQIEIKAKGQLKCQIYPSMQLGGTPNQLYRQVKNGVVDVVWTLPGYTPGIFKITEVFELPFMTSSVRAMNKAIMTFYEKYLQEEYKDVKVLLLHVHAPGTIHTSKKLIKTMDDLKGMKLRLPNQKIAQTIKALGATPVGMPAPACYESLSRGVVDGALFPYQVITSLRINEVAKKHTHSNLYTTVFLFAMNKKTYENLPENLKKIIDESSGWHLIEPVTQAWEEAEKIGRQEAEQLGHEFHDLSTNEAQKWKELTQPIINEWISSVDGGQEFYSSAKLLISKFSQLEHES